MVHFKKYFSSFISHFSTPRGFTLIELIIYIGILSVLLGVMSSVFTTVVDVQLESNATASVDQDGRYLLGKLLHDFQANTPVVIKQPKDPGTQTNYLQLNLNNSLSDTIYSVDGNGNLQLTESSASAQLNSYDTNISSFSATRIGLNDSHDTVRVSFTIRSRTKERSGYETKTFTSTFAGHN
ncbi:MAG: PilW family protein [Candidatus Levyibacteriota bacterium]